MNFPNLTAGQVSIKAIAMGGMATLFTCLVLYPPRHTELADSHALITFEVIKATVLLMILGRVYLPDGGFVDRGFVDGFRGQGFRGQGFRGQGFQGQEQLLVRFPHRTA
jgi:hypothetical protein